jgi:two-component system chemotaxis response regulator CheY
MDITNQKVLTIDDHSLIRRVVGASLKEMGVTKIDEAVDGASAIEKIQKAADAAVPYDIVLLDWNIPSPNGFEILQACRKDKRLDDMAIIMLTAEQSEANVLKALEAGATAYLGKPFKPEAFVKKVEDVVRWRAGKSHVVR